jgi:hypothetical protein
MQIFSVAGAFLRRYLSKRFQFEHGTHDLRLNPDVICRRGRT